MKVLPWLLVAGLLVGGFFGNRHYSEQIAQLEHRKAQVDTVYLTDTLRLTKVYRITDSVLATVDTIIHVDTVRVLLANERAACNAVIQTCEQRVAIRDSIIAVLKKKPSVLSKLPWILGGMLAGKILLK